MVQQWKQWCRFCAREDYNNSHVNIFVKNEEVSQLCDVVSKCFSINIRVQDGLPQTICTKCRQFIDAIIEFSQKTGKVQAMYSKFLNSIDDIDPGQLKAHYDIRDLDEEVDLKVFSHSADGQLVETKPSITTGIAEQMIDLDELEYIDEELYNNANIKAENTEEDTLVVHDKDWSEEDHITTAGNESDEYASSKVQLESEDSEQMPKRRPRGRPKKTASSQPNRENDSFTCTDCSKSFTRFPNYRQHMQLEHGVTLEPQRFPCTKCNKVFNTAGRLQDHATSHLPLDQKRTIPCPYCDKKFTKAGVVQGHVSSVHMGEKPFICEECGKTYKTFGALKEHKLTHTAESLFKCRWCEKRFKSKPRLKIHEDTHNETNYVCTTCGLQLNTRRTLRMHMVVHSDQKRHKCDFCGNEYKRAKALKNHLILHTGLKPYTCNFCEKTFANGSNCRSHKKKAHPAELAALEAAGTKCVSATNIPKLEQLKAVTASKAAILPSLNTDPDYSENVSVVSLPDDVGNDSLTETPANQEQIGLLHAVFGSVVDS